MLSFIFAFRELWRLTTLPVRRKKNHVPEVDTRCLRRSGVAPHPGWVLVTQVREDLGLPPISYIFASPNLAGTTSWHMTTCSEKELRVGDNPRAELERAEELLKNSLYARYWQKQIMQEFRDRLGKEKACEVANVSFRTWEGYERGKSLPFGKLIALIETDSFRFIPEDAD